MANQPSNSVNPILLKNEIRAAIINTKANACPITIRKAWHASGTYDKSDNTGGSNGATMRFEPESTDDANAGLTIVGDMLNVVKQKYPEVSTADLWNFAGVCAVEFMGGPKIPFRFGRTDDPNGKRCPANGRLPDANQGAQHLRDVFYRMGFNDRDIVALSGAHTAGRCHASRSGFDGPWTDNPLVWDNDYYKVLMQRTWKKREWDGPLQFEDAETGKLMMLPTDMALMTDEKFRPFVEMYANDEKRWHQDFADAFGRLLELGVPSLVTPPELTEQQKASAEFREYAMHGSLYHMKKVADKADVHEPELTSKRTALHKAALWGHHGVIRYLIEECKLNVNSVDVNGDSALHDAARFGHEQVVQLLLNGGADKSIRNLKGETALDVAKFNNYDKLIQLLA